MFARLIATLALELLALSTVRADPIADFYRGKQITLLIRAAPGGNYDAYMRLCGRYFVQHIPGTPQALPVNMPEQAGGFQGAMIDTDTAMSDFIRLHER